MTEPGRVAYTVAEVAAMLGVPRSTVRGWTEMGVLPVYRIGLAGKRGRVLIPVDAFEELLLRSRFGGRAS